MTGWHGRGLDGERGCVTNGTNSLEVASDGVTRPHEVERVALVGARQ